MHARVVAASGRRSATPATGQLADGRNNACNIIYAQTCCCTAGVHTRNVATAPRACVFAAAKAGAATAHLPAGDLARPPPIAVSLPKPTTSQAADAIEISPWPCSQPGRGRTRTTQRGRGSLDREFSFQKNWGLPWACGGVKSHRLRLPPQLGPTLLTRLAFLPLSSSTTMSSIRSQLFKVARQASARRSYSALAAARPQLVQAVKPAFAVSGTSVCLPTARGRSHAKNNELNSVLIRLGCPWSQDP